MINSQLLRRVRSWHGLLLVSRLVVSAIEELLLLLNLLHLLQLLHLLLHQCLMLLLEQKHLVLLAVLNISLLVNDLRWLQGETSFDLLTWRELVLWRRAIVAVSIDHLRELTIFVELVT